MNIYKYKNEYFCENVYNIFVLMMMVMIMKLCRAKLVNISIVVLVNLNSPLSCNWKRQKYNWDVSADVTADILIRKSKSIVSISKIIPLLRQWKILYVITLYDVIITRGTERKIALFCFLHTKFMWLYARVCEGTRFYNYFTVNANEAKSRITQR